MGILLALLAAASIANADPKTTTTITTTNSPCGKSWKVLVIGGQMQPNIWPDCGQAITTVGNKDKHNHGKHNGWQKHQQRQAMEREQYRIKKEAGRKAKLDEDRRQKDVMAKDKRAKTNRNNGNDKSNGNSGNSHSNGRSK